MKKRVLMTMLTVLAVTMLAGCGGNTTKETSEDRIADEVVVEKDTTEDAEVESEEASLETEEESVTTEGYQTIGDEAKGYIDIPEDWLEFFDSSTYGMNADQYCSADMSTIITLMVYDETMVENELISQEQLDAFDAYTLASNAYYIFEEQDVQDLTAATVTLDGRSCYQVYGVSGSGMIIAWYFDDDNGYVHYICLEAPVDTVMESFEYIESSYRLK